MFGKQEAGSPSQEVALLLHRKGFDCSSTPKPPLQCTWSAQQEVDKIHTLMSLSSCLSSVFLLCFEFLVSSQSMMICLCLQVNLDELFSPLQFRSLRESGLTLLREDDDPKSDQQRITPLRPMEISAFRVELQ